MSKVLFAISLMSLLACGTGESNSGATGSASDAAPVSAAKAPTADAAKAAAVKQAPVREGQQANTAANAATVRSCIDLVASGKYEEALPRCLESVSIDASNTEVQAALEKAQSETAAKAASGAATDAAAKALGGIGN